MSKRKRQRKPNYGKIQFDRAAIDQVKYAEYLARTYNDRGIVDRYVNVCLNPSDRNGTTSIEPWERLELEEV